MKYGRRLVREAIDRFPYDKGANRKDLFMAIKERFVNGDKRNQAEQRGDFWTELKVEN